MSGASQTQQRSRSWLVLILRWIAALATVGVLLHFLPAKPLRAAVAQVPPSRFLLILLGYLLAHTVGIAKWRMVVNAGGAQLDFATSAQCYAGGLFGALFLPSIIGGDVIRLAVGLRRSPRPAAVVAGNVADRVVDATAQAGLVLLGLALLPESELLSEQLEDLGEKLALAVAAGAIALFVVMFVLRKRILAGRSVRFRRRLASLRLAVRLLSKRSRVLVFGWMVGTIIQLTFLFLTTRIAIYCGLVLPLRAWLFAWPLAKLVAVLPLTQGGIGVREAALVALLAPFGASGSLTLAAGLIWEGVVIAGGLIAGAAALLLRQSERPKRISS